MRKTFNGSSVYWSGDSELSRFVGDGRSWARYNDVSQSILWSSDQAQLWISDTDGNLLAKRHNDNMSFDAITYDTYNGTFWTTKEKSPSEIYNFAISPITGAIVVLDKIRYKDGADELEACVADPYDGTLWLLDDTSNQTKLIHAERTGDGLDGDNDYQQISSVSIYNADPLLGVASGQGMCYDTRTGTLWITANIGQRLYNYTTAGVLISSLPVSGFGAGNNLQGIYYDHFSDTFWIAERAVGVRNVSRAGALLKLVASVTYAAGPTGVCLIQRHFAPLVPQLWYQMDETSGTSLADKMNHHIGITGNAITPGTGRGGVGSAVDFEADTDQFVTFANELTFTGDLAIALWIKFETIGGTISATVDGNTHWIGINSNSTITLRVNSSDTTYSTHGFTFQTGVWTHIVLQRGENKRWWLYVNGVAPASESGVKSGDVVVTGFGHKNGGGSNIDGFVDQYMLFDHILSTVEILRLYNDGAGLNDLFDLTVPYVGRS